MGKAFGLDLPLLRKSFAVTREEGENPTVGLLHSNVGLSWEGYATGGLGDAASPPPPLLVPRGSLDSCNDWELETEDPVYVSSLWAAARLAACNLLIVTFESAFNSLFLLPFFPQALRFF